MLSTPEFVQKWSASGAAESSNAQSFTNDLCEWLGVEKPAPSLPDDSQNTYVFEKRNGNTKFIDCYNWGHFILENKQGVSPLSFGASSGAGAMSPRDRHKLGAHYTPRAYVERLVQPTVLDPLRSEWESVQTAALSERDGGNDAEARSNVLRDLGEQQVSMGIGRGRVYLWG